MKELCWCGTSVEQHMKDARRIEESHGVKTPTLRRARPKKLVIDLDNGENDNERIDGS